MREPRFKMDRVVEGHDRGSCMGSAARSICSGRSWGRRRGPEDVENTLNPKRDYIYIALWWRIPYLLFLIVYLWRRREEHTVDKYIVRPTSDHEVLLSHFTSRLSFHEHGIPFSVPIAATCQGILMHAQGHVPIMSNITTGRR
jgi:hypothetical protein